MKELTLIASGDILEFGLSGDIDILNSGELYYEVERQFLLARKDVFIDFSKISFIDSAGLGTFVKINNLIKNNGKRLVLVNLSRQIKELFTACSLDKVLEINP